MRTELADEEKDRLRKLGGIIVLQLDTDLLPVLYGNIKEWLQTAQRVRLARPLTGATYAPTQLDPGLPPIPERRRLARLFPDCERGAIPPFGSVYHLPTLVDESLAEDEQIVFEAHNHEEAIRMAYRDYEALEHPRKGHFARHV